MSKICENYHKDACPKCGGRSFLIYSDSSTYYLTNSYGEIVDADEISNTSVGRCNTCGSIYKMLSLPSMFMPLTNLREKLLLINPTVYNEYEGKVKYIENPMMKEGS